MQIKKIELILDECASLLRKGSGVLDCKKKFPRVRGLTPLLKITELALRVPKREIGLDRGEVWNKIARAIYRNEGANSQPVHPRAYMRIPIFLRLALPRAVFAVITIVIIAGLLNSTAVAAQNSLPGQTLYPVKRTVEKIELTLTINEVKKTEVRIKHAGNRLTEAKDIVEQLPNKREEVIEKTMVELKDATEQVADESSDNKNLLEKLVELADKQETILTEIEPRVSGDTKKAVAEALTTAVETKTTAVRNLAKLEDAAQTAGNSVSTSTLDTLNNTSTQQNIVPDEGTNIQSTSTDSILKKLGSPEATTTDLALPIQSYSNDTTTPEIIESK